MGCNKQLLPWRGKTVPGCGLWALQVDGVDRWTSTVSCKPPFVAVTGDDHEKLEPIVTNYGFEAIRNDHPELGQGVIHSDGSTSFDEYVILTARRYSLFSREINHF